MSEELDTGGWDLGIDPADPKKVVLQADEGILISYDNNPLNREQSLNLALLLVNVIGMEGRDAVELVADMLRAGVRTEGEAVELIRRCIGAARFVAQEGQDSEEPMPDARDMSFDALSGAVGDPIAIRLLAARDAQLMHTLAEALEGKMSAMRDTSYAAGFWSAVCWIRTQASAFDLDSAIFGGAGRREGLFDWTPTPTRNNDSARPNFEMDERGKITPVVPPVRLKDWVPPEPGPIEVISDTTTELSEGGWVVVKSSNQVVVHDEPCYDYTCTTCKRGPHRTVEQHVVDTVLDRVLGEQENEEDEGGPGDGYVDQDGAS